MLIFLILVINGKQYLILKRKFQVMEANQRPQTSNIIPAMPIINDASNPKMARENLKTA